MGATTGRLTIEDFERLSDELADKYELVDGELIDVSGNTPRSNAIRDRLVRVLGSFVEERQLGFVISEQEYDFEGNAHGPDVTYFRAEKLPLVDPEKRVQRFVPDLAIEVVSPNDLFNTLMRKKGRYRRCGTAEVWIVVRESRELYVYSEQGDRILRADAELTSPLLPGFSIRVSQIFETF